MSAGDIGVVKIAVARVETPRFFEAADCIGGLSELSVVHAHHPQQRWRNWTEIEHALEVLDRHTHEEVQGAEGADEDVEHEEGNIIGEIQFQSVDQIVISHLQDIQST